ncbi:MAG: hypothetical protein FWE04_08435, partial [Oscillospiraceae bacterium]|nr:hypothetical protein [Oscillospiraceae bacterium]
GSAPIQHLRLRLCDFSQAVVGNGGSRLRVAITLRRFDAHFASKVQGRKILLAKSTAICQTFARQKFDQKRRAHARA